MSTDSDESTDPGLVTKAYRTVTPGFKSHEDPEMHAIGLTYIAILLVLLLPLLPFLVIVWAVTKLLSYLSSLPGSEAE
jgi:hypothetical protein